MDDKKSVIKSRIIGLIVVAVLVMGFVWSVFLRQDTPVRTTEKQFRKACDQYYKNEMSDLEFVMELRNLEKRADAVRNATGKNGVWGEASGNGLYHDIYMLRLGVELDGYAAFLEKYDSIKMRYKP